MYSTTSGADLLSASSSTAAVGGAFATFGIFIMILGVLLIVAQWKIFTKAGVEGWKSIIPIYNLITLFKICGLSPYLVLVYLAAVIPVIGTLVVLALTIVYSIKLGKAFGQSDAFIVGLVLVPPIFQLILGFGNAQYIGPQQKA